MVFLKRFDIVWNKRDFEIEFQTPLKVFQNSLNVPPLYHDWLKTLNLKNGLFI